MPTFLEIIALTKDLALIIGGAVTGYVALRGLGTWQRQLKGGAEYDLARKLLRTTYRLREAIRDARNPDIFGRPDPISADKGESSEDVRIRRFSLASAEYKVRSEKMNEAANLFRAEMLEAEVLWGPQFKDLASPLLTKVNSLNRRIHVYLVSLNPLESEQDRAVVKRLLNESTEILYNMSLTEQEDPFWNEISISISEIEDSLRKHLRR